MQRFSLLAAKAYPIRMAATAKTITVQIVSDNVCPWCWVGKKRLEKAIKNYQSTPGNEDVRFEVEWAPYQLNPDAPQDDPGRNKIDVYNEKFGKQRTAAMIPQMTDTFADEGLNYSMGGKTGSTLNSHRLVWWAKQHGGLEAQNAIIETLMKGYFSQEKYINDKEFLVEAAKAAGLPADKAREVVEDADYGRKEVEAEVRNGRMQGISGVPNFTIGNWYQLSGAQPSSVFEQVFAEVAK